MANKQDLTVGAFVKWVDGPGFEKRNDGGPHHPVSRWLGKNVSHWYDYEDDYKTIANRMWHSLPPGDARYYRASVLNALDYALKECGFPDGVEGVRKEMKEAKRGK